MTEKTPGLILVHTGNGKGKTTAALGLAMRACGRGWKVCMIQFIKGDWKTGEMEAAKWLKGFEFSHMGKGFTWNKKAPGTDARAAKATWEACKEAALSGKYNLVIFDEINNAIDYGLIPTEEVVDFLKGKPHKLHVLLTGRNAKPEIIELADTVTEMREVKHAFHKGIIAQKGIEY